MEPGIRAGENRQPRGWFSAAARMQTYTCADANLHLRRCKPESGQVQPGIRADKNRNPRDWLSVSARVRTDSRADASLHLRGCKEKPAPAGSGQKEGRSASSGEEVAASRAGAFPWVVRSCLSGQGVRAVTTGRRRRHPSRRRACFRRDSRCRACRCRRACRHPPPCGSRPACPPMRTVPSAGQT